jgi:hypothetical protein
VKILRLTWSSHSSDYEECYLLGYYTVRSSRGLTFWKNILPPSSGMKSKLSKRLARSTASLAYPSTLKMETVYFSEMLVNFYQTMWHHIPEDNTLSVRLSQYYT